MNKRNLIYLPVLILGCGGISGGLWALMQHFCIDENGLLVAGNLPQILILLITLAAAITVFLATRKLGGSNRYMDNFSPSLVGGIAAFTAAGGILLLILGNLNTQRDVLSKACLVTGLLSAVALSLTGVCRIQGKRPHFLLHSILCIFFGIHMANQYRIWSSDPQLTHYVYQLFACVFLTLTAYSHAAFDVGMGRRLRHLTAGLLAAYFCMVCVFVKGAGLFYLLSGIWSVTNLCRLEPRPRHPKPREEPPVPEAQQP